MTPIDLIGLLAGAMTTAAFIPQVVKAWRTKHTGDLSLGMYLVFLGGVILWLVYGIYLYSVPIIAANGVTMLLIILLIILKLKYG